jgi:hypothetical protein
VALHVPLGSVPTPASLFYLVTQGKDPTKEGDAGTLAPAGVGTVARKRASPFTQVSQGGEANVGGCSGACSSLQPHVGSIPASG